MLLFGILASPLGRDQPTEVWILSRLQYFMKPKRRIWDQSGINNLVTITAPKTPQKTRTKNLSQSQVKSRLKTLAMTMDTRGWAVKNANINLSHVPGYLEQEEAGDSDRLIGVSNLPQTAAIADVRPVDDILDEENNPTAKHFWDLLRIKDAERKQKMAERLKEANKSATELPKPQPSYHVPKDKDLLNIKLQEAEKAFRAEHPQKKQKTRGYSSEVTDEKQDAIKTATESQMLNTINQEQKTGAEPAQPVAVTGISQPAKLELANAGNDLTVASIQKLANRQPKIEQVSPSEVVISFH